MNNLQELIKKVIAFRDERNWKQFHNTKDLAVSISIESAELLECFQWKSLEEIKDILNSSKRLEIEEEIADVFIYLLYLSDAIGVDIVEITDKKIQINAQKYSVKKSKNSAKKYTDL